MYALLVLACLLQLGFVLSEVTIIGQVQTQRGALHLGDEEDGGETAGSDARGTHQGLCGIDNW